MRRDTFLKSIAFLPAAGTLPWTAHAGVNIKMMIPASPGGGWDATGRALGQAITDTKKVDAIQYENKGGAAGAIGLAQFVNANKGDANSLLIMGAVMLGGIINNKPAIGLDKATPIARLTSEYNVFVVSADSPFKTMKDVVEQMKKDPASVTWGGGSKGSTEHISASMLARQVGIDPKKINYVDFRGGGEVITAIFSGNVKVGGGGYSELADYIQSGTMRAIGITSRKRLQNINIPTMKEQGYDVVLDNWRGVYAAPGITPEQRAKLTALVIKATKSKAWAKALAKNKWTAALLTDKEFENFIDFEFISLRVIMFLSGMTV